MEVGEFWFGLDIGVGVEEFVVWAVMGGVGVGLKSWGECGLNVVGWVDVGFGLSLLGLG